MQELGQKNEWVSELIFGSLFGSFMLWSFSPFVTAQKRFYTAVLFSRLLMVLVSKPAQPQLLHYVLAKNVCMTPIHSLAPSQQTPERPAARLIRQHLYACTAHEADADYIV